MPSYTRLRGIASFNRDDLATCVEANLVDYFNWGCVQAGGFVDVPVPTPGTPSPYGQENLSVVHKEGVVDGAVWQAARPAWCYESGFEGGVAPTIAAGVYVNGVYYPTASTTGPFAHRVDFVRGLVAFATPIPKTSKVQAAYSYRRANFTTAQGEWFQQVVLDGYLADQTQGGVLGVLDAYRLQTPFVAVEVAGKAPSTPYELGSRNSWKRPIVLLHVIASNKADRDKLAGIVEAQEDATVAMYDRNARRAADDFELDALGGRRQGKSSYATAVDLYRWDSIRFASVIPTTNPPRFGLWTTTCRARMELVVGDL